MYHPMLSLHWKQARLLLLPMVFAAFALPLLNVQGMGSPVGATGISYIAYWAVSSSNLWISLYPLLAIVVGVTMALSAWNWDHQLKHVYALSLPVARWKYVLLKMGAGMTLLLVPSAALWAGAGLASASLSLPDALHAYPNQLALRFFLASALSYAMLFAMAAGTIRTTVALVTAILAFLVLGGPVLYLLAPALHLSPNFDFARWLMDVLVRAPGPFHVFTGNWSLIDV